MTGGVITARLRSRLVKKSDSLSGGPGAFVTDVVAIDKAAEEGVDECMADRLFAFVSG